MTRKNQNSNKRLFFSLPETSHRSSVI